MRSKVLLTEQISQVGINLLKERAEVIIAPGTSEEHLKPLIGEVDALLIRSSKASAGLIEAGKRLKVIGRHGIGLDNIDLDAATRLGIVVVHTPGANTNAVAEHSLWAMLHCARNFNKAEQAFRRGAFCGSGSLPGMVQKMCFTTTELSGKTLGLVGMGRIARRLAEIAGKCLNMRVRSYDPHVSETVFSSDGVERCDSLDSLLRGSDFISLHVPYMEETHHLIGERELACMKNTAFLINTSRGGIIDEKALCIALKSGRLAGAALDVFEEEPPAKDMAFFGFENVLVTPHMAAMTDLALVNMATDVAGGILDVLEGRRPRYLANPQIWKDHK